jgi:phosphonate transport system ATP-binding protein
MHGRAHETLRIDCGCGQQPQLILADEPIASLDLHNATRVMTALRAINREDGITVLCNLHALDMARAYCDRIMAMAQGKLVFDGPPAALTRAVTQEIYGDDAECESDVTAVEQLNHDRPANRHAELIQVRP